MNTFLTNSISSIGTGIHNVYSYLNQDSSKCVIDYCKFDSLKINYITKNYENSSLSNNIINPEQEKLEKYESQFLNKEFTVLYIIHSKNILNIHYINDSMELKCFFENKFSFNLTLAETFNIGPDKTYSKELPIVALISNSNFQSNDYMKENQSEFLNKCECFISFYSIKTRRVVHKTVFKRRILQFISNPNVFAVMKLNFTINIFSSDKMTKIFSVKTYSNQLNNVEMNINFRHYFALSDIYVLYQYDPNENSKKSSKEKFKNSKPSGTNLDSLLSPEKWIKINNNSNAHANANSSLKQLQNLTLQAYKHLYNFTDWSYKKIKDLNNLIDANGITNNLAIKNLNKSDKVSYLNLMRVDDPKESENKNIIIPYFKDRISYIKFFHGSNYFIVGNSDSQIFYIYEIYPQTNLKYESKPLDCKIIYSLYRGVTSAMINSIDWSACKKFIVISSSKGTFHLFYLPKIDDQAFENTGNFDYKSFNEVYLNITQAVFIDKIKLGNFLKKSYFKSTCKIINFSNLEADYLNLSEEVLAKLRKNMFDKNICGNILMTYCETEQSVYPNFIKYDDKNIEFAKNEKNINSLDKRVNFYPLQKLQLQMSDNQKTEEIACTNYKEFKPKVNYGNLESKGKKKFQLQLRDQIEKITTGINIPLFHLNPNFSFNVLKIGKNQTHDQNLTNKEEEAKVKKSISNKLIKIPSNNIRSSFTENSNNSSFAFNNRLSMLQIETKDRSISDQFNINNEAKEINIKEKKLSNMNLGIVTKIFLEKDNDKEKANNDDNSNNNRDQPSPENPINKTKKNCKGKENKNIDEENIRGNLAEEESNPKPNVDKLIMAQENVISFTLSRRSNSSKLNITNAVSNSGKNVFKLGQNYKKSGSGKLSFDYKESNKYDINNISNTDISFSEKILCQDIEFSEKLYNREAKISISAELVDNFRNQNNLILNPGFVSMGFCHKKKSDSPSDLLVRPYSSVCSGFEDENDKYPMIKDAFLTEKIEESLNTNILKTNDKSYNIIKKENFKIIDDFFLK